MNKHLKLIFQALRRNWTFTLRKLTYPLLAVLLMPVYSASFGIATRAYAACEDPPSQGVDWEGCRKRNLIMADFNFSGANLSRADLSSSDLRNVRLIKANLQKANLVRASLAGANATNTVFIGVVGSRTSFKGAILKKANFNKAEISRADFTDTQLTNVNMSQGELSRVKFMGAKIENATFDFTNLARSDFQGVSFSGSVSMKGTFLYRTNIQGLDMSKVTDLENWQLDMACGNDKTLLPAGMVRPASWPCQKTN